MNLGRVPVGELVELLGHCSEVEFCAQRASRADDPQVVAYRELAAGIRDELLRRGLWEDFRAVLDFA